MIRTCLSAAALFAALALSPALAQTDTPQGANGGITDPAPEATPSNATAAPTNTVAPTNAVAPTNIVAPTNATAPAETTAPASSGPAQTGADVVNADGSLKFAPLPAEKPIPLVPETATWDGFHGQLNAQKYSPLNQITTDNVGQLKKAWELHTGDMSDGSGDRPETVWSASTLR